jgi:molybdenum cofactor cytidylyltransferase
MKLGPVPVRDAAGAVLVHTIRAGGRVLKKGHVLVAADLDMLAVEHPEVVCARLEPGELAEDVAAAAIAQAMAGANVSVDPARTGRANLRAVVAGLFAADRDAIERANAIDEAITVATARIDEPVRAGQIVATIKIIPFAVAGAAVDRACASVAAIRVAAWRPHRAGLILTRFPDTHASLLDRAATSQRTRMTRIGGELAREVRVGHDVDEVAGALAELARDGIDPILALGASAIMDRRDVIPAALERAGGTIARFGMPVDPGNLLLVGRLGAATVIGVPGCARSLDRSGFDWVLERSCAGLPITSGDIATLGVGGLLDDGPRPAPRAQPHVERGIAAVVLAAGHSSRMGDSNKLLVELDGQPLIRHAVRAALASRAHPVVVITGNQSDKVRAALAGLDVVFAHNPEFSTGMASSLRTGVQAVPNAAAAMIVLGDMPRVTAAHLDQLIAAFDDAGDDGAIIVPTCERKRGNPVVWGRDHFGEIDQLAGDVGARSLIERHHSRVRTIAIDDPAILVDVDTPDALAALRKT